MSLPARGVWIEMRNMSLQAIRASRRSPRGECGLKFFHDIASYMYYLSLPARGVWIEITSPARLFAVTIWSLPARGVWIEIVDQDDSRGPPRVAPREGSVD